MEFVPIARLEEIPAGEARLFERHGVRALLTRVGDAVFALQARCPHRANPPQAQPRMNSPASNAPGAGRPASTTTNSARPKANPGNGNTFA